MGDLHRHEAVLFIDETDAPFVRLGQPVRMRLDTAPGVVISGSIEEIAEQDVQVVPQELAAGQQLASRIDAAGRPRPVRTSYQVRVVLDPHEDEASLVIGARGRGKVLVDPQTLSQRLYRFLRRTLRVQI